VLDDERLKNPDVPFVFAEGQAMRRIPMHMVEWITKLDAFLTLNERDILTHAEHIDPALKAAGWDAVADLGSPEQIRHVFVGFQRYLYESRDTVRPP